MAADPSGAEEAAFEDEAEEEEAGAEEEDEDWTELWACEDETTLDSSLLWAEEVALEEEPVEPPPQEASRVAEISSKRGFFIWFCDPFVEKRP